MAKISKLTAIGHIKDGQLILTNINRYNDDISRFKECMIELTIREKNRRSNPQNRYLWGVVYKELEIRMRELGNDVDSDVVHEICKERFNPQSIIGPGGEIIGNKGGSTAEMNKGEFMDYVDKIIKFAAEMLEISIPYPGQKLQLGFE
jgi:hypothetical protein